MAGLLPSIILRQCIDRIGGYQGQAAAIEASYVMADPSTNSKSASFTKSVMLDGLVGIEQEVAGVIGGQEDHPWQNIISDVTASIVSGNRIPSVGISTTTAKIIGKYHQVRDAASPFRPLTNDLTVADIRELSLNPATMFKSDIYSGVVERGRLYHTRPNAIIDVSIYDYDARKTVIFADGELLFTEAQDCYFSGLMSLLMNTDATLTELSKLYAPRYQAWLKALGAGQTEPQGEA
jgi:hypothetical protein